MAWVLNPNRSKVEFHSLHCDKVSSALLYRSSTLRQAQCNGWTSRLGRDKLLAQLGSKRKNLVKDQFIVLDNQSFAEYPLIVVSAFFYPRLF